MQARRLDLSQRICRQDLEYHKNGVYCKVGVSMPRSKLHLRRRQAVASRVGFTIVALLALTTACGGPLPKTSEVAESPWQSFDEAMAAYQSIVPLETTAEDLKAMGYDPFSSPNVRVLSYLEVIERFMPKDAIHVEEIGRAHV